MAIGHFDADAYGDLAVGAPESFPQPHATVLYGTTLGLKATGSQLGSQETPGVPNSHEFDDNFGVTLAAGDFDGD